MVSSLRFGNGNTPCAKRRRSLMAQPFRHPTSGIYYLRVKIPAELKGVAGKAEYKRSLRTQDLNEAKSKYPQALIECQQTFERYRAQLAGKPMYCEAEVLTIANDWFNHERAHVERTEAYVTYLSCIGSVTAADGCEYEDYDTLKNGLHEYEDCDWFKDVIDPVVNAYLRKLGHPIPPAKSAEERWFRESFEARVNELSEWALGRQEGRISLGSHLHTVLDAATLALPSYSKPPIGKSHKISDVFEAFKREKLQADGESRSTQKTLAEYASVIGMFVSLQGDMAIQTVSRETVIEHKHLLAMLPSKGQGIRGMAGHALIQKADNECLPRLTEATLKKRLTAISAVFSHAVRLGWISENPVSASQVIKIVSKAAQKKRARNKKQKDFTQQEIAQIFSSPVFSEPEWKHARVDFGEAWKWIPVLLYYTGCRREEVAQLKAKEVIEQEGSWCLDILARGDDDGRGVKNAGSRRIIPLHSDVIQRGFIEYMKGLPAEGQLFPKLSPCPKGYYGNNFGKHWGKYLQEVVQLESSASPLHGFRHTFKTLCRSVGIAEDVHDAITGHKGAANQVAREYGGMPLSRMIKELAKYPTLAQLISEASRGL